MNKKTIRFIISLLFVSCTLTAIHYVVHLNEAIEFKKIEILDNRTKIKILNDKYNNLNEQLDNTTIDKNIIDEEYKKLQEEKDRLQAELQAKIEQKNKVSVTSSVSAATTSNISGTKQDWMSAAGIPESDWWAVDYIVQKESSWNPNAVNPNGGACGLAQALPCSKLGANWNDPVVALKWQYQYVLSRYGGYPQAYNFWVANRWY